MRFRLKPTATLGAGSGWAPVGAATIHEALADESDATYITNSVVTPDDSYEVAFTENFPSFSEISGGTLVLRMSDPANGGIKSRFFALEGQGGVPPNVGTDSIWSVSSSITDYSYALPTGSGFDDLPASTAELNSLQFEHAESTVTGIRVYRVYVDFEAELIEEGWGGAVPLGF